MRLVRLTWVWRPVTVRGQIFVKGEVIKTVPEDQIVETLIEEATRIAAEMEASGEYVPEGSPAVSVS